MNATLIGAALVVSGMIIATVGIILMDAVPPLNSDFEVTSNLPVPENKMAFMVPFGLAIGAAGCVIIMFDIRTPEPS